MADVVTDNPSESRFEVRVDGELAGVVEYDRVEGGFAFTHTEVDPAFEGKGIGSVLARGALDAARAADEAVVPFCPFINTYIKRHPEYVDLVPESEREGFGLT